MTANVGKIDRTFRLILGIILLVLPFISGMGTTATVISVIVGIVMVATSSMKFCPLYRILGVNTCSL